MFSIPQVVIYGGITEGYHFLCLDETKAVPRSRSPGDATDSKPGTVGIGKE